MGRIYSVTQGDIQTGTSAKSILELATGASVEARILQWWIEFEGVSSTAAPIRVDLMRATTSMTGTAASEIEWDPGGPVATVAAEHTSTGEGTPGDILEWHNVHPQGGILVQYPLGREPVMPVSTFLVVRVTAAADVQCAAGIIWEE